MPKEQKILLIEDDELWKTNLANMLGECGYVVELATSWHRPSLY